MRKGRTRFASALLGVCGLSLSVDIAAAATDPPAFPQRPVRWVVPFPVGGSVDLVGRILAHRLGETWKQQLVIDNRPAAGGRLGTQIAAESAPDGYTQLLTLNSNLTAEKTLFKKLPYDPEKAFVPVTITSSTSQLLVVNRDFPAKNAAELIAAARAKPGQLNYGSSGVGGSLHLTMELFRSMAGIDVTHVAYKGGPLAVVDLVAGQINMMFFNTPAAVAHVKSGRIRALGVSTLKRSPLLPEVPPIAESGLPGFDTSVWYGLAVPAGTAPNVVAVTYRDVSRVLAMPEVRRALLELGAEPLGTSPSDTVRRVRIETEQWRRVITQAKINLD
jgi:tripartite-type tricarboxylate transporter receptor subunit TctC